VASLTAERGRPRADAALDRLVVALPWLGLGGAAVVIAVGLAIKAATGGLGLPLPPFLMYPGVRANVLVIVTVVALAGALGVAPAIVQRLRSPPLTAVALFLLALLLGLSLNVARDGTRGWWEVFATGHNGSIEGPYEYLPGLPVLAHGIPYFLGHFSADFPYLPLHAEGNPPGPLIALHLLGIRTAGAMAALCIGVGALTAPLAYDLGRLLGGEQRGRIAGVLTAFAPSMLLFGVTSADYAFAGLGMVVACLLVRRATWALIAGGCAAALATFFSWLLFAIPAWAALVVLQRDGWRAAARVCVAAGAGVIVFNAALAVAFGYDPFSALSATSAKYASLATSGTRTYAYYLFGAPTAWAVMLGLPIMWFGLRALGRRDRAAVAVAAVIVVASLLGFTRGETERIWLPFVPLACVAAAALVAAPPLRPGRTILAIQALAVEVLFFTVW
jgi:hypothetical protein